MSFSMITGKSQLIMSKTNKEIK